MLGNPDHPVGGLSVGRPQGVELRPLGRDDLGVALALTRALYELPDGDPELHRPAYDAFVNDPDAAPFLALFDGEPAGLILFRFRRRLNRATYEGWVSDLVVAEPHRGRGIGRMLLRAAIEEWRLRQGHALVLEAGDDRPIARQLYSSAGLREAERLWEMVPLHAIATSRPSADVRPLVEGDVEPVTRLLAELGRPAPPAERMPAIERTFADYLRRADGVAYLAELDGTAAGVLVGELRRPFYVLRPQLWISELVVTEHARGQGIGSRLLAAALADAAAADAYGASVTAPASRPAAGRLLGAAGFADVGSSFVLER